MLFVEGVKILDAPGDGVVVVLDADGEGRRRRMPPVVASEELVEETAGRVDAVRVVEREETAAVVNEI